MLKNKPQVVGVLLCKEVDEVRAQLAQLDKRVDIVEWRIDALKVYDLQDIKMILKFSTVPIMLTLRRVEQGGAFSADLNEYTAILKDLHHLQPDFLDIEYVVSKEFLDVLSEKENKTKLILSWHQMDAECDLRVRLNEFQHPGIYLYKLISKSNKTSCMLKMAHFIKEESEHINIVGHVMGELSIASRVLGAVVGNALIYGSLKPIEGLSIPLLSDLLDVYHVHTLDARTRVYGLIGAPVDHSVGHFFHNNAYQKAGHDAVYIKMPVDLSGLPEFFTLIRDLPFYGLSVTRPLKEAVIPYMHKASAFAQRVGAVNTISIDHDQYTGVNTDGFGGIKALKAVCEVQDAQVLIIGAGGAASAIAGALNDAGAHITIANRTLERALDLAKRVQGKGYTLSCLPDMGTGYDIIINAIPVQEDNLAVIAALILKQLSPNTVLFNMDYSADSHLLDDSLKGYARCQLSGKTLYEHQAVGQINTWFSEN